MSLTALVAGFAASEPAVAQMNPALVRAQCETVHEIDDQSILYGLVVDIRSGTPLPGSTVHLSWVTKRGSEDPQRTRTSTETRADSTIHVAATETRNGAYIFCDVPQDTPLRVWGEAMGVASLATEFYFDGGESTRGDHEVRLIAVTGAISGTVLDATTGDPVEAATVLVPLADVSALTDMNGHFRITDIPVGAHLAEIHHIGYGDPTLELTVNPAASTHMTIRLDPEAIALEPISVDVRLRPTWLENTGFYGRAERQLGQFVTPEEVDARPGRRLAEVLREVPGVNIRQVCVPHCSVVIAMAGSTMPGCIPAFYIDGRRVNQLTDTRGAIDLDTLVFGDDLAAVEVYRGISETPPEFYGRCGSVVLWTKRASR